MTRLRFKLEGRVGRARAGVFRTLHGEVRTPVFMPVGTQATVKNQRFESLKSSGAQVLLANTYHLMLRPGPEVFRKLGGIHRFNGWTGSVLTDSGGFQIFSLPESRTLNEAGAEFRSYVDQKLVLLTPERSIEVQRAIGSDIMMVLDQCVPSTSERELATQAMHLTHRWARRSLDARQDSPQALFGIVQGACFPDLRKQSAELLSSLPFDGFAIGGLAVGESKSEREDFTELTAALLPETLPRYLMGVGMPIDLLEAVHRGVDLFDCILPTSLAQQGVAFTQRGRVDLRRTVYRLSDEPLDPGCRCEACGSHSKAFLHHLIKCREPLGWQLVGAHNIQFYLSLMSEIRESILDGTFESYYRRQREALMKSDAEFPKGRPPKAEKAPTLGNYRISFVDREDGRRARIQQISSGEVMHPGDDPGLEAKSLYVEQSRLGVRLREVGEPWVVWDVGLGAATNAMAAIRCAELDSVRPLRLISFENDLDPLRLAIRKSAYFRHLHHPAPAVLLKSGRWRSSGDIVNWELIQGDFLETMQNAPAPDLIFYDPFSFKADATLWSLNAFTRVRARCRTASLYTYSASTLVRARLLAAGFFVARGASTGFKGETTIAHATVNGSVPEGLLDAAWLKRWERSGVRCAELDLRLQSHPQFQHILCRLQHSVAEPGLKEPTENERTRPADFRPSESERPIRSNRTVR